MLIRSTLKTEPASPLRIGESSVWVQGCRARSRRPSEEKSTRFDGKWRRDHRLAVIAVDSSAAGISTEICSVPAVGDTLSPDVGSGNASLDHY
ncbi:unnamed protein product [Heligmosomoides polygyrus]|uniref:Transposase n=1 Tax=Heligmosomoides polygyrus TaxID=6339 RepID=A0A183G6K0_HELPZ|nr:unnamed protein product [Heligmosomoides polygyrus]